MSCVQSLRPLKTYPARLLFPTGRSDVRFSWHPERDEFVLSLWHGDVCVGSAPLTPREAAELSTFVIGHFGERATWGPSVVVTNPHRARRWSNRVARTLHRAGHWLQSRGQALQRG